MVNLFYTGCPKYLTVGRRLEDRFRSLKSFAALIRQLNLRSQVLELMITIPDFQFDLGQLNRSNNDNS